MAKIQSSEYWKQRFAAVEAMNHRNAQKGVSDILPAFDRAERKIQKEIESWYERFAENNEISLYDARKFLSDADLKELKWDIEDYIAYGRANALDQQWMTQLENASARYHISRLEALKLRTQQAAEVAFGNEADVLDRVIKETYANDYYHTAYEIQKGFGVGFNVGTIDQSRLAKLMKKPWTADGMTFSNRIWRSKAQLVDAVSTELTQMCILGKVPDEAIRNIARKMQVSKSQAGRLVMTESAYFASAAQKDCFKELDVEEYEIVATLDHKTSEICQDMDGKVFKMSEFEPGVTAPPFHVWCRSTTVPYFNDEFTLTDKRAARDAEGNTIQVDANMKYADWKKSFVDGDKSGFIEFKDPISGMTTYMRKDSAQNNDGLVKTANNDIINSGAVSGARNPYSKEAEEHAEKYYGLVRSMKTDVKKIAMATGFSEEDVRKVKNYVFLDKHDLGGIEPELFESDYMMAQSWQRLIAGNPESHDITLLKHELMESKLVESGMSQSEAHMITSEKYNYAKEAGEYYAKIAKHKSE